MTPADFCGKVRWALEASDVRFSFPAYIALISGALVLLGLVLGIVGLVIALLSR